MTTDSINNQCLNDFTVTSSTNGVARTLTVTNTTNAASSAAKVLIEVAGGTAADSQVTTEINGGQVWSLGLDNSDSDAFVVSGNASLGTTNVKRIDATGVINYPLQSAFSAYPSGASNVTGDGTSYIIVYQNETFDQNADYDGTSTFTAPITGRYLLHVFNMFSGIEVAQTACQIIITTSNRNYINVINPGVCKDLINRLTLSACVLADMDAADTATIVTIFSNGTKVTDVFASAEEGDFSGFLAC